MALRLITTCSFFPGLPFHSLGKAFIFGEAGGDANAQVKTYEQWLPCIYDPQQPNSHRSSKRFRRPPRNETLLLLLDPILKPVQLGALVSFAEREKAYSQARRGLIPQTYFALIRISDDAPTSWHTEHSQCLGGSFDTSVSCFAAACWSSSRRLSEMSPLITPMEPSSSSSSLALSTTASSRQSFSQPSARRSERSWPRHWLQQ